MKTNFFSKLFLLNVFFLLNTTIIFSQTNFSSDVTYSIPKNESYFNSTQTTILLKFQNFIKQDTDFIKSNITILNNETSILFNVVLLSDFKTIILKPINNFSYKSKVEVTVNDGFSFYDYDPIKGFKFSFYTLENVDIKKINFIEDYPYLKNEIVKTKVDAIDSTNYLMNNINNQFPIEITAKNGKSSGYYFLASLVNNPKTLNRLLILNSDGEIVYERLTNEFYIDFKKINDDNFCYFNVTQQLYVLLDQNFKEIRQIKAGNGYATDNHELIYDSKTGNFLILAMENAIIDMSDSIYGGLTRTEVLGNIIQEIDRDNNVVFEWKALDYLPINASKGVNLIASSIDYTHSNAIEIFNDTCLLLSCRHLNEIEKINRNNGKLEWRLGLKATNNDFRFDNDTNGFTYQHDIRVLPNGNLTLFDNGNLRTGSEKYSRALEYKLDEVNKIAHLVWQYRNTPDVYSPFMGSVRRHLNGNTTIGWGGSNTKTFTEIDSKNNKVFECFIPAMLSYRVYNFDNTSIPSGNLVNIQNPLNLFFCNEDSLLIKSQIQNQLIPNYIKENSNVLSKLIFNKDTAIVYVKTSNNFYGKTKTLLNFNYTKLDLKDTIICKGDRLFLNLTEACSNAKYKWSINDTSATIVINPDSSAYYWVEVSNGDYLRRDSTYVEVSEVSGFNILGAKSFNQPFSVLTYSLPFKENFDYKWYINKGNIIVNPFIKNAVQIQFDSSSSTQLSAIVTNENGCLFSQTISINYIGTNSSNNEIKYKNIEIYPNPTNGIVNVKSPKEFTYKINDYSGKEVYSSTNKLTFSEAIDLSNFANGLYLLILNIDNDSVIYKINKSF